MAGRFLRLFSPISRFLPTIRQPERRIGLNEKLLWTGIALALYLVMSEIPLYGIGRGAEDPMYYLRVIFASNRGTLMELGIGPIVTAGLILQLLAGSGIIECDLSNPQDRSLFTSASKAFSMIFTGIQASAYIIGGVYGTLEATTAIIVFLQLLTAGIIIILLDEMVQKGWGIGSGISLFIMAGVAQKIFWDSFGLTAPIGAGDGRSYGAFIALVQTIMMGQPLVSFQLTRDADGQLVPAVPNAFLRSGDLPAMLGFITTIVVFLIVIYMEGVRVEVQISHADYRGFRGRYPIKLLYVSNLPVIFASALFANIYFFSQLFWSMSGRPRPGEGSILLELLGTYRVEQGQPIPVGGLVYFVIPPRNLLGFLEDPLRGIIYVLIMITFCILFALTWLEVGGLGPSTVAKQLMDAGMHIPGFRRAQRPIESVLKRYIPAVTVLGAIIIGLIASVSDFFGVFGSGMGVLLSVGIIYQYYQLLVQERAAEMYPAFRRIFGE